MHIRAHSLISVVVIALRKVLSPTTVHSLYIAHIIMFGIHRNGPGYKCIMLLRNNFSKEL